MSTQLEDRVSRLERLVVDLMRERRPDDLPGRDDWKKVVGMFAGDAVVGEILEEARRLRIEDRARTERLPSASA